MLRRLIAGTASLALCLAPMTPAIAQDYRFAGYDAPRGAAATVDLRVPLGRRAKPARPTLGLTLGYGQTVGGPALDGRTPVRRIRLAELRLDRDGLNQARLASFDLADADEEDDGVDREPDNKKSTFLILLMIVAGMTALTLVVTDHGSRKDEPEDDPDYVPPSPG